MSDIGLWLDRLGLGKYQAAFDKAEIDFETLPELREDDLKELGLPLGPRRKIWAALSRMSSQSVASPVVSNHAGFAAAQAERRHLTVMFVDLVGSTEMVMRMDAEDMRGIITAYQKAVAKVVDDFNGFIATLLGDGMLCYFGWPHASEDDTDRAVRAGLAVIEATRKITTPDGSPLASRVGVASGVVVVGDLTGGTARQEAAVVGETPNLAARLQGLAAPNQLVVPGEVLPLLGSNFVLTPRGPQKLKGVDRTVEAFVVEGETFAESRFSARRSGDIMPIVGRNREIDIVIDRWAEAVAGRGQMVMLSGEAGIGKSRVVKAIVDVAALNHHTRIFYQCSPYHTDSAFYPFIQQITHEAGIVGGDSAEDRLNKIEKLTRDDATLAAPIAVLLGLDGATRFEVPELSSTDLRSSLMNALVSFIRKRAKDKPLLLVFEDLHWVDPTSLEVLHLILDGATDQKIMILGTSRPTFEHNFATDTRVTQLKLNRLARDGIYAMVDRLTEGKALPADILATIAQRTDGVPLFVEELTKTILESNVLVESGDRYVLNGAVKDIAIPATLHDSLTERLDRLHGTKEIAQIASCIGREFSYQLLAKVCDWPSDALETALDELISAELIQRHGTSQEATFLFKHALVRDAAYESLLKEVRRSFHRKILDALETGAEAAPELLAAHAEAAQLTERAIALWEAAGNAAISKPAYQEGETHLRRAIALNTPMVEADDQDAIVRAIALKVQLFVALAPGKGLWADEALQTLEEALDLASKVGDTPLQGDIIYGLLLSTYFRGSLQTSMARAAELIELADASGDVAQALVAKRLAGIVRLKMGQFQEAQTYLDEAEALCESAAKENLAARFGHDPVIGVQIYQAFIATFRGQTRVFDTYRLKAERRAKELDHPNTDCTMHGLLVACAQLANDIAAERRHLTILEQLVEEHDVTASRMWNNASRALLQMADGDHDGLAAYQEADARMIAANVKLLVPGNRVVAARRAIDLGLMDEARALMQSAGALMNETGEKSWLPDIFRLRATFAWDTGDDQSAEKYLKKAIALSQASGGVLWELRASIDLARLYQETERDDLVISAIRPVFDKIGDGDCRLEMAAAKDLMLGFISAK
ncbi:ATP-binding protein [Cognatiyoonia sp. IB215182]|uniref:ATP-binding protein n=1 Tax=Cognatiyoonia sp. IB215182 TaxID=3097353 RepID=UPI002A113372|nr:adenylate/guanylate cyclase domain-containing protein [Cognatiyoonia sp. IB215182]MDX8354893.1 adenylate/guanylate cyclase domain-containing protein [Cognatiyoonia sp. IB215182]